jgi:hypothetical protein
VTYRFKEEFTIDNILRFMDYAAVGKIERNYRSQEVPMYQTGPIMLIVGDTFEQLVEKSGKDVFIEFMAAWCKDWYGHGLMLAKNSTLSCSDWLTRSATTRTS